MLSEFRDFVNRGNFVEIAVAFVMGAAFGRVVTALTERIVTPLVGLIVQIEFSDIGTFGPVDSATGQPSGSVGAFVEAFINFVIIAFVMFLVIRAYNGLKARMAEPSAEAGTSEPEDVVLLREIRDSLAGR